MARRIFTVVISKQQEDPAGTLNAYTCKVHNHLEEQPIDNATSTSMVAFSRQQEMLNI